MYMSRGVVLKTWNGLLKHSFSVSMCLALNVSSAVLPLPLRGKGGPASAFSLFLVAFVPVFNLVSILLFQYFKKYHLYLRKRPTRFIILTSIALWTAWGGTCLFDYLGPEGYPCWLLGLLFYISPVIATMSLASKLSNFFIEVQQVRFIQYSPDGQEMVHFHSIQPIVRWDTFSAHIRTAFGCRRMDKYKEEALKNLQFAKSYSYLFLWLGISSLPVSIGYLYRLLSDANWYLGCTGCILTEVDCVILIAEYAIGFCFGQLGLLKAAFKDSKRKDPLRILRESYYILTTSILSIIGLILYLTTSPVYHGFDWLNVVLFTYIFLVYLQTVHQIVMAKYLSVQLLSSRHQLLNREDLYLDVLNNKELLASFKRHLDFELSSEIYLFLEAVDKFKKAEPGSQVQVTDAEFILKSFIKRNAPFEVNISSTAREQITNAFQQNSLPEFTIFDAAYTEVKIELLNDGFARFLNKLSEENNNNSRVLTLFPTSGRLSIYSH